MATGVYFTLQVNVGEMLDSFASHASPVCIIGKSGTSEDLDQIFKLQVQDTFEVPSFEIFRVLTFY